MNEEAESPLAEQPERKPRVSGFWYFSRAGDNMIITYEESNVITYTFEKGILVSREVQPAGD